MIKRVERKAELIKALAEFLTGNMAEMSIKLQLGKPEATRWADLWSAAGMMGYPTKDEAIERLTELLG